MKRRPEHILLAWITGVGVHIVLNFTLIPRYGMMGAGLSTLVGYCIVAVVATMVSLRLYDIPYQYKRLFKLAIAITLVYSCNLLIPGEYFGVRSILKLILLGTFPLILWVIGFFNKDEIALVKSTLHLPTRQPSTEPSTKPGSSEDDHAHLS